MPDREKYIEILSKVAKTMKEFNEDTPIKISLQCVEDILELLQEQEAVEPKTEQSAKGYWFTCGSCGWWLFQVCDTVHFEDRKRIHFCASCGREVKWE